MFVHHIHILLASIGIVEVLFLGLLFIKLSLPFAIEVEGIDQMEQILTAGLIAQFRNAFVGLLRAPGIDGIHCTDRNCSDRTV